MMNAVELGGVAKHLEAALENIGNDTAADEDVLRPDLRPFLTAELGEKARAGRAIIALAFARWRTFVAPTARTILARSAGFGSRDYASIRKGLTAASSGRHDSD